MAKEKKEFPGSLNPCCCTLNFYCKGKPGCASLGVSEKEDYFVTRYQYGKANILAFYLYDERGGITDVVFDLRKVYKKYGKKFGEYQNFLGAILNRTNLPFFYLEEWNEYEYEETIEAIGCPIAGMPTRPFHKYCVWAPSLDDLIKTLDLVLGNSFHNIDSDSMEKIITKTASGSVLPFIVLLGLGTFGGLLLIILAIAGTISKVVGWLFGIILLLGCGLALAIFISAYKDLANYFTSKDEETKYVVAEYSQFQ